jgi:hypothetical protein
MFVMLGRARITRSSLARRSLLSKAMPSNDLPP